MVWVAEGGRWVDAEGRQFGRRVERAAGGASDRGAVRRAATTAAAVVQPLYVPHDIIVLQALGLVLLVRLVQLLLLVVVWVLLLLLLLVGCGVPVLAGMVHIRAGPPAANRLAGALQLPLLLLQLQQLLLVLLVQPLRRARGRPRPPTATAPVLHLPRIQRRRLPHPPLEHLRLPHPPLVGRHDRGDPSVLTTAVPGAPMRPERSAHCCKARAR